MIYCDASSLLKLIWNEPESPDVVAQVAAEPTVMVSTLGLLEAQVQLKSGVLSGRFTRARCTSFRARLAHMLGTPPFELRVVPPAVFDRALSHAIDERQPHCRTLDRLHLGAMLEFGLERLLTHDDRQAQAARALGFTVLTPGR